MFFQNLSLRDAGSAPCGDCSHALPEASGGPLRLAWSRVRHPMCVSGPVDGRIPAHSATREDGPDAVAVESLREELLREQDRYLRTRAEFENYRRRAERERETSGNQARSDLLLALVDLADGFDRALAHVNDSPDSVAAGLHGMQRSLRSLLEAEGVKPFESLGRTFDPARHEAVATARDTGRAPGTVVDEAARGYVWKGGLLRPARVRVTE